MAVAPDGKSIDVNPTAVHDLADVEPVLEQMRQRTDAEADAATHAAIEPDSRLGPDAAPVEVLDQGSHRAEVEIAPEDGPDRLGLLGYHHDLLVDAPV